jgi:hypothetical protein
MAASAENNGGGGVSSKWRNQAIMANQRHGNENEMWRKRKQWRKTAKAAWRENGVSIGGSVKWRNGGVSIVKWRQRNGVKIMASVSASGE